MPPLIKMPTTIANPCSNSLQQNWMFQNYTDGNRGNNSDSLGRGRPARNSLLTDQRNAAALETPTGSSPLDQASGQLQRLKEEFERSRSYSASEGSGNKVIASQKVQHTSVHNRFTPNDSANISSSSSNENRLGAPLAPTNQHLSKSRLSLSKQMEMK